RGHEGAGGAPLAVRAARPLLVARRDPVAAESLAGAALPRALARVVGRGEQNMVAPIGSLLVGSSNVEAMKDWYRRAFNIKENDMGAFEFGPVQLFIEEHSEVSGPAKEPARIIINLDVPDCREAERQL